MRIYHLDESSWTEEPDYNTIAKRFFPWDGIAAKDWGGAWVKVLPGETSTLHSHEENEVFFIVRGGGVLKHGGEEHRVSFGSTMYMQPGVEHCLTNDGTEDIVFLSVWWDGPVDIAPAPAS